MAALPARKHAGIVESSMRRKLALVGPGLLPVKARALRTWDCPTAMSSLSDSWGYTAVHTMSVHLQGLPMLSNNEGQRVPDVTFKTRKDDQWVEVKTADIFAGKNVVVFSLPGAYTPTCSSTHLPRFNELARTFKANGIDEVVCFPSTMPL
jgi:hypothetical protein